MSEQKREPLVTAEALDAVLFVGIFAVALVLAFTGRPLDAIFCLLLLWFKEWYARK